MGSKEFITTTIIEVKDKTFDGIKKYLLGEYIVFNHVKDDDVTREIFAEKLNDYFDFLCNNINISFAELTKKYTYEWDDVVKNRVSSGKGSEESRAIKYYNRAKETKSTRNLTTKKLEDYTRIMMCLYMSIINNSYKNISDFDYRLKSVDLDIVISSMKNERVDAGPIPIIGGKRIKYDTSDLYSFDTCMFIMTIIIYCYMMNNNVEEEYK